MEKTKISAKVIADSVNEFGNRITSFEVIMPRIILAEFNTHRMFSRNSASSRAIPFAKMIEMVEKDPFIPIAWQKDHKGMQGTNYFSDSDKFMENTSYPEAIKVTWLQARDNAIKEAKLLSALGVPKQLCNRLLEPFMWHRVIVTATELENFFALRCPRYNLWHFIDGENKIYRSKSDLLREGIDYEPIGSQSDLFWLMRNEGQAEIHMMALAEAMWDAYNESTPKKLKAGEWHVPYGDDIKDLQEYKVSPEDEQMIKVKIATARCAGVSYTVVGDDGNVEDYEKLTKRHDKLLASGHMSPFEHCARCTQPGLLENGWSGNFYGWEQYRKMLPNESIFQG